MQARTAAVPVLVAVLLSGCAAGVDEADGADAAPRPSATASAAPTSSGTAQPTASATSQVRTIEVSYSGGQVTGTSGREEVRLGEQVVLRVSSDVAEQVHVHGYDVEAAVPAGGSAEIPVSATIPGVFEVEMHDSGKVLYQLRVA